MYITHGWEEKNKYVNPAINVEIADGHVVPYDSYDRVIAVGGGAIMDPEKSREKLT